MSSIIALDETHLRALVQEHIRAFGDNVDLNHIDVSQLDRIDGVFRDTSFQGDISQWNVSCVKRFNCLFLRSTFNGDISQWDTSSAISMVGMFSHSRFNGDISRWDVSGVKDMSLMFRESAFDGDISLWRPTALKNAALMFKDAAFSGSVSHWCPGDLQKVSAMFETPAFHGDLSRWSIPPSALQGSIVHPDFHGVLPSSDNTGVEDKDYFRIVPVVYGQAQPWHHCAYATMLGRHAPLQAYVRRTPFSLVHADLLLEAPQMCTWASQEEVRWASEVREMGRAVGMPGAALRALMVQEHSNKTRPLDLLPVHLLVDNMEFIQP